MRRFRNKKAGEGKVNTETKPRLPFCNRIRKPRWPFKRRDTLLGMIIVLNFCIIIGFTAEAYVTHKKMEQLVYQMSYLNDTNSILLTDVNNMQSDIKKTLEEEASLLESWEIALDDMNFADETYTVNIHIAPKEYTETMTATIYFGTHAFPLKLNGFQFSGMAELTLDEAFDGNVTVLFADGKSRKTEVLSDYSDVRTDLTQVLYGKLSSLPEYEDGMLNLEENGYVRLDAGDFFAFQSLELIVEENGNLLKTYDLAAMSNGDNISIVDENGSKIDNSGTDENITEAGAAGGNVTGGNMSDGSAAGESVTNGNTIGGNGTDKTTADTDNALSEFKETDDTVYADTLTDAEKAALGSNPASSASGMLSEESGSNLPLTWLAYSYMINDSLSVPEAGHVRVYLKAVSENGFVFTYDLLNFDIVDQDQTASDGGENSVSVSADTAGNSSASANTTMDDKAEATENSSKDAIAPTTAAAETKTGGTTNTGADAKASGADGTATDSKSSEASGANTAEGAEAEDSDAEGSLDDGSVLDSILEIFDNGENSYGIIDETSISWESNAVVYDSDGNDYWLTE